MWTFMTYVIQRKFISHAIMHMLWILQLQDIEGKLELRVIQGLSHANETLGGMCKNVFCELFSRYKSH